MKNKYIQIRIDDELKEKFTATLNERGDHISSVIRKMIISYLAEDQTHSPPKEIITAKPPKIEAQKDATPPLKNSDIKNINDF